MNLDPTQLDAVEHAAKARFSVITGGAGTGKTTIIKALLDRLEANGDKPILCAYAGKAAARMKEATGADASTIHRMLGYDGLGFRLDTLRGKTVIVDEASMVDSKMMAEIINRNPEKLILVGDYEQLPPVGEGQPFHDIIGNVPEAVYRLTKCYRNSEAVFRAATAIRNGDPVSMQEESETERWRIIGTGNEARTHALILQQVEAGFFDFDQDIILCPKNGDKDTPSTVKGLNASIAAIVAPRELHERLVPGDRVMNTKNLPNKDIWNGTTGKVQAVDTDGGVHMELDEPIIDWKRSGLEETVYKSSIRLTKQEAAKLELAYAMTVHKSQGSQYRKVCFVCLSRDARALLTRSLIYTAVTRTRQECIVVGEHWAFLEGCKREQNKSTLIQRLAQMESSV